MPGGQLCVIPVMGDARKETPIGDGLYLRWCEHTFGASPSPPLKKWNPFIHPLQVAWVCSWVTSAWCWSGSATSSRPHAAARPSTSHMTPGTRRCLWALAMTYGEPVAHCGSWWLATWLSSSHPKNICLAIPWGKMMAFSPWGAGHSLFAADVYANIGLLHYWHWKAYQLVGQSLARFLCGRNFIRDPTMLGWSVNLKTLCCPDDCLNCW